MKETYNQGIELGRLEQVQWRSLSEILRGLKIMKLTVDQVKKVAKLADLPLSGEETEKYSEQLSKILDYIGKLNEVETEGVEPTFNVSGAENLMSADAPKACLSQNEALQNAPVKKDGFFVTKGVFEE